MRKTASLLCALLLAGLVVALAGCSAGTSGLLQTLGSRYAPAQVSAVLFVQQWGQTLFGLVSRQTGTQRPSVGQPVFNDDGSVSQTFRGADGTESVLTVFPDGSAVLEITYPDGRTQTVHQSVPQFDGVSVTTTTWEVTSSDGTQVNYTSVLDDRGTVFDSSDDTTALQGSSVLPDGLRQDFTATTVGDRTTIHSEQSDGSTFDLEVPLPGPGAMLPDFTQDATGRYVFDGTQVDFALSSTPESPDRWAQMASDFGDGVSGEFILGPDFSGSGRLLESDGELAALPSWTQTGETQVSSVTADSAQTVPAGAALDYLTHRWQTLAASMGPQPGG